ncbi:Uncharacterized protein HZ326_23627 [Fusarium oxysporum f. sp. albedinis]|nr:Uncharacterized protein HZ326_23627 [Fusarium oxysporum f. sp. albedinis]
MQGLSETAATAVSGLSDAAEEVQATAGRPRRDSALTLTSDFTLALLDINYHYPIADDYYRSLLPNCLIRENLIFLAANRIQSYSLQERARLL